MKKLFICLALLLSGCATQDIKNDKIVDRHWPKYNQIVDNGGGNFNKELI